MKVGHCYYKVLTVACFWGLVLSAGADGASTLKYYQDQVRDKETGVYQHDGFLYVHVRLPYGKGDRVDYKKVEAVKCCREMIRSWAIAYAESKRGSANPQPKGVLFAQRIVDKFYPQWRHTNWFFQGQTQVAIPNTANGAFTTGMIVSQKEVVDQIPDSFSQEVPMEDLFDAIRLVVKSFGAGKSGELKLSCDVPDLTGATSERVKAEYEAVSNQIVQCLNDSKFARGIRNDMQRIAEAVETSRYRDIAAEPRVERFELSSCCTNEMKQFRSVTNAIARTQTHEEVSRRGMSNGCRVSVTEVSGDKSEVVSVVTQMVVTTRKVTRRLIKDVSSGDPVFERAFLGGFSPSVVAKEATARGEAAADAAKGKSPLSVKLKELHLALQENPYDKSAWNLYGRCLQLSGEKLPAIVCFKRALTLDSNYDFALANLALAYAEDGRKELAYGLAFLAYGITEDKWVKTKAEDLLTGD